MSNLIEAFGSLDRFYSKFNSSMFFDEENNICYVSQNDSTGNRGMIACRKLRYTASGRVSAQTERVEKPQDFFSDMGVFATPELGWRTAAGGKVLIHFSRRESYHRGLTVGTLTKDVSDMTRWLAGAEVVDIGTETTNNKLMNMVMQPEYKTMAEGLIGLREGRLASFAVSARVAVTPNVDDTCDIWYKTKRIGSVAADGTITCPMKFISQIN